MRFKAFAVLAIATMWVVYGYAIWHVFVSNDQWRKTDIVLAVIVGAVVLFATRWFQKEIKVVS